jgi:bifunctional enzyme CysN/CysC
VGVPALAGLPRLRRAGRRRARAHRRRNRQHHLRQALEGEVDRHRRARGGLAFDGQSILLTLEDEIDVSRGDVLAAAAAPPPPPTSSARTCCGWATTRCCPAALLAEARHAHGFRRRHRDPLQGRHQHQEHIAAKRLELNEVANVHLSLDQPIAFESHEDNRLLGSFILIDRQSFATVACGTLDFALHRAANVHWQALDVDQGKRAR